MVGYERRTATGVSSLIGSEPGKGKPSAGGSIHWINRCQVCRNNSWSEYTNFFGTGCGTIRLTSLCMAERLRSLRIRDIEVIHSTGAMLLDIPSIMMCIKGPWRIMRVPMCQACSAGGKRRLKEIHACFPSCLAAQSEASPCA